MKSVFRPLDDVNQLVELCMSSHSPEDTFNPSEDINPEQESGSYPQSFKTASMMNDLRDKTSLLGQQ